MERATTDKKGKMTRGLFLAGMTALTAGHRRWGIATLAAGLYVAEKRVRETTDQRDLWRRRRDDHEHIKRTGIARAARIISAPMLAAGTYGLIVGRPGKLRWAASVGALSGAYLCRAVEKRTSSERAIELGQDPLGYIASASWDWSTLVRGDRPRVDGDTITMQDRR